MTDAPTPKTRLLSSEDAAEYIDELFGLEVTPRWLERQIRERRMSYFKIGGMVRFSTDDLDQLLDNARVEAINPLNRIATNGGTETIDDENIDELIEEDEEDEVIEEAPAPKPKPKAKPKPTPRRRRRTSNA